MKSSIKKLLAGELTPEQILRDHLVLITTQGEEQPNSKTVIDPELVEKLIEDFRRGDTSRRMCFFDPATNSIKNGIPFRASNETKSGR